jgi:hypothetical protein
MLEQKQAALHPLWHTMPVSEVVIELKTSVDKGISSEDAMYRLKEYGPNQLLKAGKVSIFTLFINQFKNSFILLLLFATVVSGVLGHMVEADGWHPGRFVPKFDCLITKRRLSQALYADVIKGNLAFLDLGANCILCSYSPLAFLDRANTFVKLHFSRLNLLLRKIKTELK